MIRLLTTHGSSVVDCPAERARYVFRTNPREQRLVAAAHFASCGEQQDTCGQAVQPVRGAQFRQTQRPTQPHRRGLRDVSAPRHGREEMRLVDDHNVVVAVQHRDVERHRHLWGQFTVEVHERARRHHAAAVEHSPVGVDDLASRHLGRGHRTEPGTELVDHGPALQPQPCGAEPVAHGQRGRPQLSGTGSRISARASGAACRSASADSSSGCCCDRTSASTPAM